MTRLSAALTTPLEDDGSKRRQILDGARALFMSLGFDAASMGEIARAAGVSKGTLYVYFADKNALFEAIVEEELVEAARTTFNFDPGRDAETTLTEFGAAYVALLCRPEGGSAIRTVMAIAERMPQVGRNFYQGAIEGTIGRLGAYLQARIGCGELQIEDVRLAAAQFMLMCQALLFQPFIFQTAAAPSAAEIARVVKEATRVFLAAHRRS